MTIKLDTPPIVEAVVDIDCDMPPGLSIESHEQAFRDLLRSNYPKFRKQMLHGFQLETSVGAPPKVSTTTDGLQAIQFLVEDEKQLVQIRTNGFSFNKLAPYSSLDSYVGEIEKSWGVFCEVIKPLLVRQVQLRYINRLELPLVNGTVDLDDFFRVGPKAPDEDRLGFMGFLNQHAMVEVATGSRVNTVLAAQPAEEGKLPIIFDITAQCARNVDIRAWEEILEIIQSLRDLKNVVFEKSLTKKCLDLYQQH